MVNTIIIIVVNIIPIMIIIILLIIIILINIILLILRTTSSLCLSILGGRTGHFLAMLQMEGSAATRFSSIKYPADNIIFLNFR